MELCSVDQSIIVFLDLQERLIAVIEGNNTAQIVNNSSRLLQAAKILDVPVIFTEQYSKGLGSTHRTLLEARPENSHIVQKNSFSACDSDEFMQLIKDSGRKQVILCGLEAHTSILQTAFALMNADYEVFVVEDAVCARHGNNLTNGLNRISMAGAQVTNRESVIYEWVRNSEHKNFREIVRNFLSE